MPKNEGLKSYHIGNKRDTISACRSWVKQVFCIHRIFTKVKTGKKTEEIVYGITSLTQQKASPKTILKFSRGHWSIENGLHYVRDTAFREDHSQIRTQNAPRAMASLKNLVVGLFHFLNVPNITECYVLE
ncbi:hypothetical protein KsCSTR_25910 [Candidatus Kuenenia stuttgartiensis]|uniref:Hypothetcal protein n=2 Tax=Kuenenia stuttgartiensis TaxID=174633 RepID=Q1Q750_KUEST|nr:transposase [Candidatus Kuenenia stuttgartiensis]MBE7549017.1 transposase [Planctomycetia bacterium]QII11970.1 hypothetical protein KsCSTR_25910 [Candidatus Kuenenia stuttgartiensis]CAJ73401.1 hypothetcal protein [Candidatus Kuenenia stuttgartiensis]